MIPRVLHHNPPSANQLKLEEMLRATRNFSIVGLVATQRRSPVGLEIGSSKQFGCTIVDEPRSVTNWLENSSHCANPSLRNTYIRRGHHHHHCKVEHSRHVSKEVSSICLFVACTFLPDHKLHRKEEGIRGLWNVHWNG